MITYLSGTIKLKGPNYLVIMTQGGVGYKVQVPTEILTKTAIDEKYEIFTYTHVKEDALDLYGFESLEKLGMFEFLIGVSGVGPKTALAIFSNGNVIKIKEAIEKGDVDFFTTAPRVGRKNAQKIIIELRPKLGKLGDLDLSGESEESKEIIDALKTFGFNPSESKDAIKSIKDLEGDTSVKIRAALKYLGKK